MIKWADFVFPPLNLWSVSSSYWRYYHDIPEQHSFTTIPRKDLPIHPVFNQPNIKSRFKG